MRVHSPGNSKRKRLRKLTMRIIRKFVNALSKHRHRSDNHENPDSLAQGFVATRIWQPTETSRIPL